MLLHLKMRGIIYSYLVSVCQPWKDFSRNREGTNRIYSSPFLGWVKNLGLWLEVGVEEVAMDFLFGKDDTCPVTFFIGNGLLFACSPEEENFAIYGELGEDFSVGGGVVSHVHSIPCQQKGTRKRLPKVFFKGEELPVGDQINGFSPGNDGGILTIVVHHGSPEEKNRLIDFESVFCGLSILVEKYHPIGMNMEHNHGFWIFDEEKPFADFFYHLEISFTKKIFSFYPASEGGVVVACLKANLIPCCLGNVGARENITGLKNI